MGSYAYLDGVIINRAAAETVDSAASAGEVAGKEVMGLLFGVRFVTPAGETGVWIVHAVEAQGQEGSAVHVRMPAEAYGPAWDDCWAVWRRHGLESLRSSKGSEPVRPLVVGWWHSHPNMSSYMSQVDVENTREAFYHPWQVSYVVAPPANDRVFFGWTSDRSRPDVPLPARLWDRPEEALAECLADAAQRLLFEGGDGHG